MVLPHALEQMLKRPAMYVPTVEYDVVAGFMLGFNLASNGGLLVGFHEWLVPKVGYGNNLAWTELVLHLAFPDAEAPRQMLEGDGQKRAVQLLFNLIEEFCGERQSSDGLRRIYLKYEQWLQRQDWYEASSPQ